MIAAPTNVKALGRQEPVDPIGAGLAGQRAPAFEVVQMGQRLTECETHLVAVELALEQHR